MEIEKRHCNICLQALAIKTFLKEDASIRSIVPITKLTERECEIAISSMMSNGFIENIDEIIKPNTILKISLDGMSEINKINERTGHSFGSFLSMNHEIDSISNDKKELAEKKNQEYNDFFKSHMWIQTGSYDNGSGQITRDKWYPFGSYCKKCGIRTQAFSKNPQKCLK